MAVPLSPIVAFHHVMSCHVKETQGLLLGPLGMDYRFSHDVIFSSFHPLQV